MLSPLPVLIGALAALPLLAAATSITGSGTIAVLVGQAGTNTSYDTTTPSDAVGCLNAAGRVVLRNCATFTFAASHVVVVADANTNTTNTNTNTNTTTAAAAVGTGGPLCSFSNTSQPANTEDVYGANVHALHCWDHAAASAEATFYTINGLPYTFLGTGDINLYYDIPGLPVGDADEISLWYFVWGDMAKTVPPGHFKAMLLWEPTSTS